MYKHILVAIDGSELSAPAVHHAVGLARSLGAKLSAVYVVAPYAGAGSAANPGEGSCCPHASENATSS